MAVTDQTVAPVPNSSAAAPSEQPEHYEPPTAPGWDVTRAAETSALAQIQRHLARPAAVRVARGMSLFGEHAAGWLALGLLGAAADGPRRREWLAAVAGTAAAHGASIAVKRVVRRPRPNDLSVTVLVGTPSRLSFPSSHASSTTAAAVLLGGLIGARRVAVPAVVPPMLLSRLVLGVHFPSDVLAGSVLGAAVAAVTPRVARPRPLDDRDTSS